jgi:hypothetical protein
MSKNRRFLPIFDEFSPKISGNLGFRKNDQKTRKTHDFFKFSRKSRSQESPEFTPKSLILGCFYLFLPVFRYFLDLFCPFFDLGRSRKMPMLLGPDPKFYKNSAFFINIEKPRSGRLLLFKKH